MKPSESIQHLTLEPADNQRLARLCGPLDQYLSQIEAYLGVEINHRGNAFDITGIPKSIEKAVQVLEMIYQLTESKEEISGSQIQLMLKSIDETDKELQQQQLQQFAQASIRLENAKIMPRTRNQHHYLEAIKKYDINFGIGPSGTGKTYLAVACALEAFLKEKVNRIVLVRPAVEAGEKLGFLPGDLAQKVDPYLRPIYDALYEMLGTEKIGHFISKGVIEIAPLAYMRGRTLNDSFIILDEGQNTTQEQMKMFLTRIGFGSKAVITGDITQVDLPKKQASGLRHAIMLLKSIPEIHFTFLKSEDVVRHPLVQKIIEAYEHEETNK